MREMMVDFLEEEYGDEITTALQGKRIVVKDTDSDDIVLILVTASTIAKQQKNIDSWDGAHRDQRLGSTQEEVDG